MTSVEDTPLRILIADDEALVRGGFRVLIDAEPGMVVVGEVGDGAAAIELARQTHPDVVLMDIRMPGVDGLAATRTIAADADLAGVHVLVLTTFDHDENVIEALRVGAAGFLVKNTEPRQLLHGIRVVAGGEALLSPGLTRRLVARLVDRPGTPYVDDSVLTRLEVIGLCKAAGFTLDEIRVLLSDATPGRPASRSLARAKLTAIDAQMATLKRAREIIEWAMNCPCTSVDTCDCGTQAVSGSPC